MKILIHSSNVFELQLFAVCSVAAAAAAAILSHLSGMPVPVPAAAVVIAVIGVLLFKRVSRRRVNVLALSG